MPSCVRVPGDFGRRAIAGQLLEDRIVEHRVVGRRHFQIERLGVAHQQHAAHLVGMRVEIQVPGLDALGIGAQHVADRPGSDCRRVGRRR